MTVQLDGTKPLWVTRRLYLAFILEHSLEIFANASSGDANADLLVDLFIALSQKESEKLWSGVIIATECYIHDHHPDIAEIVSGYPKDDTRAMAYTLHTRDQSQ